MARDGTTRDSNVKVSTIRKPKALMEKVADIIAGAVVDLAYAKGENPKITFEVPLGL